MRLLFQKPEVEIITSAAQHEYCKNKAQNLNLRGFFSFFFKNKSNLRFVLGERKGIYCIRKLLYNLPRFIWVMFILLF